VLELGCGSARVVSRLPAEAQLVASSWSNKSFHIKDARSHEHQISRHISQPHVSARFYAYLYIFICGPGSSVGIATELRAGQSGIESRWGRDFPPVETGPGAHPASCKMGTGSFPGVKCGRVVLLTTHLLLVPRSCKSRAILLPTLWAKPGL